MLVGNAFDEHRFNTLKNAEGFITKAQFLDVCRAEEPEGSNVDSVNSGGSENINGGVVHNTDEVEMDTIVDEAPTTNEVDIDDDGQVELLSTPEVEEELRVACGKLKKGMKSNAKNARDLIAAGVNPETQDEDGWTALFYAASDGLVEQTRLLVNECNVNVDTVDEDGCSALWNAAYNNQRQTATILLSRGADLELLGKESGSASGGGIKASMAARRNNNPGLADMLDAEQRLRVKDCTRKEKLLSGELPEEEFLHSLKAEEVCPSTNK
jgi:hypothetical protein